MQTTGCMPAIARPAAKVTACCSQIPTSKKRSGNSLAKFKRPVDEAMAAVMAQQVRDLVLDPLISRIDAKLRKMSGEAANRRRVGATVVVDHDDEVRRLEVRNLVESFVGHPAGQGPVADHRDDKTGLTLAQPGLGEAQRVAQGGRRMAVLDQVVLGLLA